MAPSLTKSSCSKEHWRCKRSTGIVPEADFDCRGKLSCPLEGERGEAAAIAGASTRCDQPEHFWADRPQTPRELSNLVTSFLGVDPWRAIREPTLNFGYQPLEHCRRPFGFAQHHDTPGIVEDGKVELEGIRRQFEQDAICRVPLVQDGVRIGGDLRQ